MEYLSTFLPHYLVAVFFFGVASMAVGWASGRSHRKNRSNQHE